MQQVKVSCKCGCCGEEFESHRARTGEKLCADCIGLRRALKGFLKRGLSSEEVLKRGKKLLGVKPAKRAKVEEQVAAEVQ